MKVKHSSSRLLRPVDYLPAGFKVHQVADTGVSVIDNFCTPEEAANIIEKARPLLYRSRIVIGNESVEDTYRTSSTASVHGPGRQDPELLPLLYRGSMLLGVPHTHVETVFVTRYSAGEYYKAHEDFFPGFHGDRLYTVLIYLNDLTPAQGGGTTFDKLNIGVSPKLGRAVSWTNRNPDGTGHPETQHEALPVTEDGEKWAIQLWFRRYELIPDARNETPASAREPDSPIAADTPLPEGVFRLGDS